jgi:hypothetical protein
LSASGRTIDNHYDIDFQFFHHTLSTAYSL